jgi:hypothetical protein
MRISVQKNDPDYRPDAHRYKVYFNDELCNDIIVADEDKGKVEVVCRDESGRVIYEYGLRGYKSEIKRGKVEIVPPGRIEDDGYGHTTYY